MFREKAKRQEERGTIGARKRQIVCLEKETNRLEAELDIARDTIHELAVDWQVQEMKAERLKHAMDQAGRYLADCLAPAAAAGVLSAALKREDEIEGGS